MKLKRVLTSSAVVAGVAGVAVTAAVLANSSAASSRLYGVQQVVNDIATSDDEFNILEIVPDHAYSSFGLYVEGNEPAISSSLLSSLGGYNDMAGRKAKVQEILDAAKNTGLVTVPDNFYSEQLYSPNNTIQAGENWSELTLDVGHQEVRTGKYVLAEEAGLEPGTGDYMDYSVIGFYQNLVSVTRADASVVTDFTDYVPAVNDTLTFSVAVNSATTMELNVSLDTTLKTGVVEDAAVTWDPANTALSFEENTASFMLGGLQNEVITYSYMLTDADIAADKAIESSVRAIVKYTLTDSETGESSTSQVDFTTGTTIIAPVVSTVNITKINDQEYSDAASDIVLNDGDVVTYTVSITNRTGSALSSVVWEDSWGGYDHTSGLEAGATYTSGEQQYTYAADSSANVVKVTYPTNVMVVGETVSSGSMTYIPGEGTYVWKDCTAAEGGSEESVQFEKVYFKANYKSTKVFAEKVLELTGEDRDENNKPLSDKINVISLTPAELEEKIALGEINLASMDLLYLSNTAVFTGVDAAYSEENDISAVTASQIKSYVGETGLPIIIDSKLVGDESLNIRKLSYELFHKDSAAEMGEKGYIFQSVYVLNGSVIDGDLSTVIYRQGDVKGIDEVIGGGAAIINELENDDLYVTAAGSDKISEYQNNKLVISKATLLKYIINFSGRRTVLYKDVITVLDLEPTKYSQLKPEDVKNWIGVGNTEYDKIQNIKIVQMSTSEYIGKLENLIENYDLVYIGSCVGPKGVTGSLNQNSQSGNYNTDYNDNNMDNLIYAHVGDYRSNVSASSSGLLNKEQGVKYETRYSGNDITEDKYEELLEYAEAGYPIVVSAHFFSNGQLNKQYIDCNSYLYKLIDEVGNGYTHTSIISEETYEQHKTEEGYAKNVTYEYRHNYVKEATNNKLEKVTDLNQLNENDRYVLVLANPDEDWKNKVITRAGDNFGYDSNLQSRIDASNGETVELAASDSLVDVQWRIRKGAYDSTYRLQVNEDNKYLGISKDGLQLKDGSSDKRKLEIISGNVSGSFAFKRDEKERYLNQGSQNAPSTSTSKDNGSSWYIYKIIPGTSAEQKSDEITEYAYNQAVDKFGSEENAANNGYYKYEHVSYTYTYSNDKLPNLFASADGTVPGLAKYINMPRLNLVMTQVPTQYSSHTDDDGLINAITWLDPRNNKYYLDYEFEFSNTAEDGSSDTTYTVKVFVDVNADGRFAEAEELDSLDVVESATGAAVGYNELKSGVRYRVSRELPQDYVGLIPWKLTVSLNSADGVSDVHAASHGYTAISPKTNAKGEAVAPTLIKVLQILPGSNALDLTKDACFPALIGNVESFMNYDLDITVVKVDDLINDYNNKHYTGAADYYENYLKNFDMMIYGYQDTFNNKDIAKKEVIDAMTMFIEAGKSTMFSHDLTSFNNGHYGNGWGYNINQYLRSVAGMDRFGITEESLSFLKDTDLQAHALTADQINAIKAANKDIAWVAKSESGLTHYNTEGFTNFHISRYSESTSQKKDIVGGFGGNHGNNRLTTSISQENEGQITTYPFNVNITATADGETYTVRRKADGDHSGFYVEEAAKSAVASTHGQYYQLDLNYDKDNDGKNDLVVWYSLAGSDYDAVVNDIRNNYYIYSVGNITYTGMGHSGSDNTKVTLKEAQLFINTIIAAYNAGTKDPSVNIVSNLNNKNSSVDYVYRSFDEDSALEEDAEDEELGFYINDVNVIQGTKTVEAALYYEISVDTYNAAVAQYGSAKEAKTHGFYATTDNQGNAVYLKQYADGEVGSVAVKQDSITNNVIATLTLKGSWMNKVLAGKITGIHPERLWIGARTWLDYTASNRVDTYTERSFDYITIKRRDMLNLD